MKFKNRARIFLYSVLASSMLMFVSCGNNPTDKAQTEQKKHSSSAATGQNVPAPAATDHAEDEKKKPAESFLPDIPVRSVESELSPEARETYAYLLYEQAMQAEDEAALLETAALLKQSHAPAGIWLDGGAWLMSRKSPNSVVYLEQAISAFPEDLSLNIYCAEALLEHGMAERGIVLMQKFLERHPDSLEAKLELMLLLVKDKKFGEAEKILRDIPQNARTPLVDYYEAQALNGMGKRSEAISYLRKAVKGMPDFVDALAELAFLYEQEEDWREARKVYEKLQKLHFSPQDVSLRLVNISLRLKQPEKALQYINNGPETIPFLFACANMLIEAKHYLSAETILKKIAARENAPAEVYLLLANLTFEQRRNLELAFSWLDKVPAKSKFADRAMLLRIQLLFESGKVRDALDKARQCQKDFPENPEFSDLEIRILAKEKQSAQALATAEQALKKWPDNPELAFLYGSLLDEAGRKADAFQAMENILKNSPDHYQALNYIGYTLAEENRDLDRAISLLTRANDLSPNQAYIIDSLAWALFRAGKLKEALEKIREAVSLDEQNDAAIWEHYGDIASKAGNRDEARKAYKKALGMKPGNAPSLRERLSRL